jgi:hypothetical protein
MTAVLSVIVPTSIGHVHHAFEHTHGRELAPEANCFISVTLTPNCAHPSEHLF